MNPKRNDGAGRRSRRAPVDPFPFDSSTNSHSDEGAAFFRRSADAKADRKARQLCRQVFRTLSLALDGCGDDVLQALSVVAVDPAPDASRLLVTVAAGPSSAGGSSIMDVLARLDRATGHLRAEVARAIVRKRAPELSFRVLPGGSGTHE